MHVEPARGLRDVAIAHFIDALDVLPLDAGQARRGVGDLGAALAVAVEGLEDLLGVDRLGQIIICPRLQSFYTLLRLGTGATLGLVGGGRYRAVDFDLFAGSTLAFVAGEHVFDGGRVAGPGSARLDGVATLRTDTSMALRGLVLDGGTLTGSGHFDLTDLEWRGGFFSGGGSARAVPAKSAVVPGNTLPSSTACFLSAS